MHLLLMKKYILHKNSFVFVLFLFLISVQSCLPKDEWAYSGDAPSIVFAKDTVKFDTLFPTTTIETRSITKRVWLYNKENRKVTFERLYLENGISSAYELTINGVVSKDFENITLLGNDSLLVLITISFSFPLAPDAPFLIEDAIVGQSKNAIARCVLTAYGQNAHFLDSVVLPCDDTVWKSNKPYVIIGGVLVAEGCTLRIDPGTRLHFAPGALLVVEGTLLFQGKADSLIVLQGLRLDKAYQNQRSQWQGIVFGSSSQHNYLLHTNIKNAVNGVQYIRDNSLALADENNEITLDKCIIENMGFSGVFTLNIDLKMQNCLVYNCLKFTTLVGGTGNFNFYYNTIVNYNYSFTRDDASVAFTDYLNGGSFIVSGTPNCTLENNIFWGSLSEEIFVSEGLALNAKHNLVRSNNVLFDGNGNLKNLDPRFEDSFNRNYLLTEYSSVLGKGNPLGTISDDLLGKTRKIDQTEIGCYEYFPE